MLTSLTIASLFVLLSLGVYLGFDKAFNLFSTANNRVTKFIQRIKLFAHVMHRAVVRYRELSNKSFITNF